MNGVSREWCEPWHVLLVVVARRTNVRARVVEHYMLSSSASSSAQYRCNDVVLVLRFGYGLCSLFEYFAWLTLTMWFIDAVGTKGEALSYCIRRRYDVHVYLLT